MAEKSSDQQEVKRLYFRATHLLCFYLAPVYLALSFFAEPFVVFVYGEKWQVTGGLLSILAVAGFAQLLIQPASVVMRSQTLLHKDVQINVEIILLFALYLPFWWDGELNSLAWFLVGSFVYHYLRALSLIMGFFKLSLADWWHEMSGIFRYVLVFTLSMMAALALLEHFHSALPPGLMLIFGALLFLPCFVFASYLLPCDSVRLERQKLFGALKAKLSARLAKDTPTKGSIS